MFACFDLRGARVVNSNLCFNVSIMNFYELKVLQCVILTRSDL